MSFINDTLARLKGAWGTLPVQTKGQIMKELGVPDGVNPFPIPPAAPITTSSEEEEVEIIDAEFRETPRQEKDDDLDDAFGV